MTEYKKIYLTPAGYNKLQKIKKIFNDSKPHFTTKVNRAKSHGDLRENFEYNVAVGEKNMIDNKISTINQKISNCYVIDINKIKETKIVYGALIMYEQIEGDEPGKDDYFLLVGDEESNLDYKLLSMESVLGSKLIGKRADDQFQNNNNTYIIKEVKYDADFVNKIITESSDMEIAAIQRSIEEDLASIQKDEAQESEDG